MTYLKNLTPFLLAFFGGVFYALGFPIFNGTTTFLAPLVGFFLLNWSLHLTQTKNYSLKKQMLIGIAYSLGFYLMGFYWIPETLKEFGGLFFPWNIFLGLFFSLFLIPQVYFYIIAKKYIASPLILAFLYVVLENFIPQQFPAHIGHSFMALTPLIDLTFAPLAGAAFYSFLTALIALSTLHHLVHKKAPKTAYATIIALVLLHLPTQFNPRYLAKSPNEKMNVRIVQPNVGNFVKIESERGGRGAIRQVLNDYYELSTYSAKNLDLIIWPETAYPSSFFSEHAIDNPDYSFNPLFHDIVAKTNADLFFGGYDSRPISEKTSYQSDYNATFHVGNDLVMKNVYHKMKLIPFGEGLPFGPFNPYLSKIITNIAYFSEGEKYTGFTTKNGSAFVSSICYEILFPSFIRTLLNEQKTEAQFLINVTNDSWYGDTAEPHQHLFLTKWRALEFNIPLVRSTNTGISTIVYPDGSESARLNYNEKNYLDLELHLLDREATLFQKLGFGSLTILFAFLVLVELITKRKAFFQEIMKSDKA